MAIDHPDHCEITGCHSRYLGTNALGIVVTKRGKADVFVTVNDRVRGVCCKCYLEISQREGTACSAHLKTADSQYDPEKLKAQP